LKKVALISVSDKSGILEFARGLVKLGYEIVSTGGSYKHLTQNKIKVKRVEDLTGFPEILGGRVKTLNPSIFGGILNKNQNSYFKEIRNYRNKLMHGFKKPTKPDLFFLSLFQLFEKIFPTKPISIDLVCVNLYPFEATIAKKGVKESEAIENIDIGGVSLLRASAKNFERVVVVASPSKYGEVLEKLKNGMKREERKQLASEAFAQTQKYDSLIANYLGKENLIPTFEFQKDLRYGENPHQEAFLFHEVGNGKANLTNAKVLQGKELSFNNLMDADFAIRIPFDFSQPSCAIIKHANPCGVALSGRIEDALQKALDSDKKSPFGGIIALNRSVNLACAKIIQPLFIEVVVAPSFEKSALKLLAKKKNLRLLAIGNFVNDENEIDFKKIGGGVLVQKRDTRIVKESELKIVSKRIPTKQQIKDLLFASTVCKHAKSNAIVLAKDGVAVGIGAGQTARVDAVEIAVAKAGSRVSGSVLASDAFFPFADGVEAATKAGVSAIIQPGGSIRDKEVVKAANQANIAMVFSGVRGFKH
jgi:phosphoribosylaminoimidazolecarboxamide formyltransferase/IMP cyclohydrolase